MSEEYSSDKEDVENLQYGTDDGINDSRGIENGERERVSPKDIKNTSNHGISTHEAYDDQTYDNIKEYSENETEHTYSQLNPTYKNTIEASKRGASSDSQINNDRSDYDSGTIQNRAHSMDTVPHDAYNDTEKDITVDYTADDHTQNDLKQSDTQTGYKKDAFHTYNYPQNNLNQSDTQTGYKKEELSEQDMKTLYFVKYNADKELSKDITIDLLTYLVAFKLTNRPQNRKMRKAKIYKFISVIVIICICLGICIYMFKKDDATSEMYKIVDDPSMFASINYFGKENVMETMLGRITRMIALIERNDKKLLESKITAAKKNFLFYGDPGTGKTHFIKKYAFFLDQNLKLYELRKKKVNIKNMSRKQLLDEMKKIKPQVRLISIQPSSLNDKYVGGTEKNIHKLWEHAKNDKNYAITIIFMDEIDSFFAKRKEENSEHSTNVKSEFLCILDGVRSDLSDRVMFIGATNMPKSLDEAFLRRFHTKICFQKPLPDERRQLIESFMVYNEIRLTEAEIQKIVDASKDLSQSQISRIFSDAADLSDELTYAADSNDIHILLQNISAAGNNAEAELAEINIMMRGTEHGYVFLNTFVQQ